MNVSNKAEFSCFSGQNSTHIPTHSWTNTVGTYCGYLCILCWRNVLPNNTYFLFYAGEITNFSRLIEMCMEGFPQAVILISLLIVSLEHKNIRGWIVNTLDTQLLPYKVIFAIFAIKTIFGYVMTVSNIRYDLFFCKFYDFLCKFSLYNIINNHYIFLWI